MNAPAECENKGMLRIPKRLTASREVCRLAILFFFVWGVNVSDAGSTEARFGWEPTFTNEEILAVDVEKKTSDGRVYSWNVSVPENQKYIELLKEDIEKNCPKCKTSRTTNKHGAKSWQIIHPNGIQYKITPDPSVVEIIVRAQTVNTYSKNKDIFQGMVFDGARRVGLKPHVMEGQGHISLFMDVFGDASKEGDEALLFRNFVVDMVNHPELGLGVFENNPLDAPVVAASKEKLKAFKVMLSKYDKTIEGKTIRSFVQNINQVYQSTHKSSLYSATHDQGLRVNSALAEGDSARVELRTFRPQASFDEFLLQTTLIEKRIQYLKTLKKEIPLKIKGTPTVSEAKVLFKKFVAETGLDWNDYKEFVPDEWRSPANGLMSCSKAMNVFTQQDLIFR